MDLKDKLKELDHQKSELELELSKEAWAKWFEEGEKLLKSVVNKAFIVKNNNSFHMFKVNSYEKSNWLGNYNWKGWFQVNTEGYFTINAAGHIYGRGVDINYNKDGLFGTFPFRKTHNKTKLQYTSFLDYKSMNMRNCCGVDTHKVLYFGYRGEEYENSGYAYKKAPEYSVKSWLVDIWGWYEVPMEFYNECKSLVDTIACETDKLWGKYEKIIPECKLIK